MRYQVEELGIGEILDQAIVLLKKRFALLLSITLVIYVPFLALLGLVQVALAPAPPSHPTAADLAEYQLQTLRSLPIQMLISVLFFVAVWPLTSAAVTFAVANEYLDRPVTVGVAMRRGMRLLAPYLGTGLLYYFAFCGGMMLLVVPGILLALWLALWGQVVVIEGVAGVDALKRSKFLMKGNVGKLLVMAIIVWVIGASVGMNANFIPEPHVRVLVSAMLSGPIFAFGVAASVVFYFSCRCKAENFDLTLLADSVAVE